MLYDGHINCGADILSEDTSDKRDKYKDYEEIANDEDLQRSVGSEELENYTTESSQNSDPDVLDDYCLELKAPSPRLLMTGKLTRIWLGWRLNARVAIP